jgi:hypothetical protein
MVGYAVELGWAADAEADPEADTCADADAEALMLVDEPLEALEAEAEAELALALVLEGPPEDEAEADVLVEVILPGWTILKTTPSVSGHKSDPVGTQVYKFPPAGRQPARQGIYYNVCA